ncbi:MAG: hypothetical protein ABI183_11630 [Polyangiaceae bacterium]
MSFGLSFGVLAALVTGWFFLTCLHGRLPSQQAQAFFLGKGALSAPIGVAPASVAAQTVALLDVGMDDAASDGGVRELGDRGQARGWSNSVAESSERKPDPAANPFLDYTPIRVARRSMTHRHHGQKHHQKVVHHHH